MNPNSPVILRCMTLSSLSAAALLAASVPAALAQDLSPAFRIIEQAVSDGDFPGASALVMQNGETLAAEAYGLCDVKQQRPFRTDTICWIASLTKPVTATAATTLVEQGKLSLDDSVEQYLPEFAEQKTAAGTHVPIKVRQLMSHSSGLQSSVPLRPDFFFVQSWYQQPLPEVASAMAETELIFEPGRQVQYSNAAPYVLARIIEIQSGQPFGEFVRTRVLDPLQMSDTMFDVPAEKVGRTAVVYRRQQGELVEFCRYDANWKVAMTMPDGGLFSTPAHIAKFAEAFLNGGRGVLKPESVTEMLTRQSDGYGLGWILDRPNQFSHWGSSGALVWADRETKVVGVLFVQVQDRRMVSDLHDRFRAAVTAAMSGN